MEKDTHGLLGRRRHRERCDHTMALLKNAHVEDRCLAHAHSVLPKDISVVKARRRSFERRDSCVACGSLQYEHRREVHYRRHLVESSRWDVCGAERTLHTGKGYAQEQGVVAR